MVKIDMVKQQLSFKPPDLPTAKSPGDRGGCQLSLSPSAPLYRKRRTGRRQVLMGFVAAVHNIETSY